MLWRIEGSGKSLEAGVIGDEKLPDMDAQIAGRLSSSFVLLFTLSPSVHVLFQHFSHR